MYKSSFMEEDLLATTPMPRFKFKSHKKRVDVKGFDTHGYNGQNINIKT